LAAYLLGCLLKYQFLPLNGAFNHSSVVTNGWMEEASIGGGGVGQEGRKRGSFLRFPNDGVCLFLYTIYLQCVQSVRQTGRHVEHVR
jgi:hypothetical protein